MPKDLLKFSQDFHTSVAHRYWNAQLSDSENRRIYGRDACAEGIGSNMRLEVQILAAKSPAPEVWAQSIQLLKSLVDHQCLFEDGAAFEVIPSTLENITQYLAAALFKQACPGGEWLSLTATESEHLACTVTTDATELHFRHLNLQMTCRGAVDPVTGLLLAREPVQKAVRDVFLRSEATDADPQTWSEDLFFQLKSHVKSLISLRIDLGRHKYLAVHSEA